MKKLFIFLMLVLASCRAQSISNNKRPVICGMTNVDVILLFDKLYLNGDSTFIFTDCTKRMTIWAGTWRFIGGDTVLLNDKKGKIAKVIINLSVKKAKSNIIKLKEGEELKIYDN